MHIWGQALVSLAALCVVATQFTKSGTRPLQVPQAQPLPQPPDSGRACSCSGVVSRTLDCSNRGRSTLTSKDLCRGHTRKVDLSNNQFVALPYSWGSHIVQVNVSYNQLQALPRAPPLNAKTSELDVSYNQIAHSSDELSSLSSLKTLVVTGNRLQSLNFLPTPCALRRLQANSNQLRSVQGPLNTCRKLETLDLSHNQLGTLQRGALSGLKELERLKMVSAGLQSVAEGVFDELRELQYLDMSENSLSSLPSGLFAQLKELKRLLLYANNIASLSGDVFSGLRKVRTIILTENNITSLPQDLFSGLNKIEDIVLNTNMVKSLPERIFAGLRKLKRIDLSSNQLETLPPRIFFGSPSLKYIFLRGNRLTKIPVDLFSRVSNLDVLDLSNNRLTAISHGFLQGVKSINIVNLSLNHISALHGSDLGGPKSIDNLNLEYNAITSLPVFDNSWPKIEKIFLENNQMTEVSETALRSWLDSGDQKRVVNLGVEPPLRLLESLHWALSEKKVTTTVSSKCACGSLNRGKAEVQFCTAVSCPGTVASWVDAVRASGRASVKG